MLDSKWSANTNSWTRVNKTGGPLWRREREREKKDTAEYSRVWVLQSLRRQLFAVNGSQTFCITNCCGTSLNPLLLLHRHQARQGCRGYLLLEASSSRLFARQVKTRLRSAVPLSGELFFFFFFYFFFNLTANHADALQMSWWRLEGKDIDREEGCARCCSDSKAKCCSWCPPDLRRRKKSLTLFNTVTTESIPFPRRHTRPLSRLSMATDDK